MPDPPDGLHHLATSAAERRIIVAGATSIVGHFLLPRLVAAGYEVHALSRRAPSQEGPSETSARVIWHQIDVTRDLGRWSIDATRLIHLAPLWLLPDALDGFAARGLRRVIAFSSTSRYTMADSTSKLQREVATRLADAESTVSRLCGDLGIPWTIFRPTMIYGAQLDKNVSTIGAFIWRFRFFPLAGSGRGLRQPVHADDLAVACLVALDATATHGRAYNLSGGETISYREMVERIFVGLGLTPRIVPLPTRALRAALRLGSMLPPLAHLDPAMAERMESDFSFDHTAATADLGYWPRSFVYPG